MRKLLTLLLLSIVCIPLSARSYKLHLWQQNGTNYNTSVIGQVGSNWVLEVNGSDFDTWGVAGNDGKVYLLPFVVSESGQSNNYYKLGSYSEFTNSGDSKTYNKESSTYSGNSGLVLPSDYANKKFIFTISSNDNDFDDITITVTWSDNVYTTSVDLLGTINNWAEATNVLTKDGSEYKLELTKAQVAGALYNGDFYFRFIEHMSDDSKYAVVPNVIQTPLTVNGGYTSDTYATTNTTGDNKKDYYWKFTPTGANNYTIYFKNDNGTRSVKVTDDHPIWYLHSNLGNTNDWEGVTDYALIYNPASGFYERTLTQSEISGAKDSDVRFRIYDGSNSWGCGTDGTQSGSTYYWTFDNEGSESYSSTIAGGTQNYFSIPKDFISAKIEAKPATGGGILVNVTLVYDVNYYWVSPEITNGEKWEYFKMVPSRNRNQAGGGDGVADGKISKKYYTFTIKNEDLVTWKTKKKITDDTPIHWYIVREDDGLAFRPETNKDNPEPTEESTELKYTVGKGASAVTYTDDAVGYRNFMGYKDEGATRKGYFQFNKGYGDTGKTKKALAYTFMINDEKGNVFFNYAHEPASTSIGYDLVGNFKGATSSVNIDINDGRTMTPYYYYNHGEVSTSLDAVKAAVSDVSKCDSIVYKVEVEKPANGWGNLYIDVNPQGNTDWSKVLRPLISLGNNLDGRALHGALTTAKSEQSLNPEPSDSYQSYTFSFNATTRTYKLEFNMPDATLSPGYENNEYVFDNSWGETIAVKYSDGTKHSSAATRCYIVAGGSSAISLDGVTARNKDDFSSFNLTYDGTYIYMNGEQVATGNTVYIKIQGADDENKKGDVHLYQYTFNAKMSFEPRGGLFINSAKIKIEGGVPPYRYEIWHYNTTEENGETVIDKTNGAVKASFGTFSDTEYNADDNNHRISTPGFLKIIDAHGLEMSYDEVGGGFDFTYSTSENYKPYYSNTAGGYSTIDADDAGAYPNGADYWKAAPGDLSYKLDPTWGGNPDISDESSEVLDWKGEATKHVNNGAGLSQTVTGLNTDGTKTYTVQAIVRGKGEKDKTVTLTLEGAETVTKTVNLRNSLGGKEDDADLSRNGSEVTRTGRVEYIEPMTFSSTGYGYATGDDYYKQAGTGWVKVEAKAKANDSGELTIKIKGEEDEYGWFNLSTVTLLEDANTTHGFRTTASATATEVGTESGKPYDYRARNIQSGWKQNNAYSFFDRGKNRNAVIFANERTVIAMDKSLLAPECPNRDIDRRHPFNVVGSDEDDSNHGVAKALYLTDMGYGSDENNPVDYKIGTKGADGFNSSGYKDSGYTFMPIYGFLAENVILDRTPGVSEKEQTTIMLPFSITVDELKQYYGNDLQVWDYTGFDLNTRKVSLSVVADKLIANKPYMLTGANGTLDSRKVEAYRNKKRIIAPVAYTLHHSSNITDGGFSGTYEYITVKREDENKTETHYGFRATEGTFTIASESGAKLKPFRAYFTLPISYAQLKKKLGIAESRTFSIVFDADATTGITQTEEVRLAPANVYNINGVLMNSVGNLEGLPKGIYIMNGKKFVVK